MTERVLQISLAYPFVSPSLPSSPHPLPPDRRRAVALVARIEATEVVFGLLGVAETTRYRCCDGGRTILTVFSGLLGCPEGELTSIFARRCVTGATEGTFLVSEAKTWSLSDHLLTHQKQLEQSNHN